MLVLHTERLTIRPFTEDDAALILELVNDAEWLRFIGDRQMHSLDAADGFFHAGDSGELAPGGQLKLTGRVEELFKTSKGKYVAPAPIQTRLNAHPMVEQAVASGVGQPQPYALVVLAESLRPHLDDATVRERFEADLTQLLHTVNQALAAHERLDRLVVVHEPWSVENGCLTPTMKVRRGRIEASVAPQVHGWTGRPGPVLWA